MGEITAFSAAGTLRTTSDNYGGIGIGPLWIPDEMEIYGTPMAFLNLLVRDVEKRLPQGQQRLERIAADERQQRIYFIK